MKKYCFLVDTSVDLTYALPKNVHILPLEIIKTINHKETVYKDYEEISHSEIKKALNEGIDLKTSQTPYGLIQQKLEELLLSYEKIICVVISRHLSGVFDSYNKIVQNLEKEYGKNRILVLDTKSISIQQNYLIEIADKEMKKGTPFPEIEKIVKKASEKFCGFTIVTNATQLIKGGRLTGLKALLVKALNIKIVIRWQDGVLKFIDKSKSLYDAIDKGIIDSFKQLHIPKKQIESISVFSDLSEEDTKKYVDYVSEKISEYYNGKYYIGHFPSVILTHLGDKSFSIIVKIKNEK